MSSLASSSNQEISPNAFHPLNRQSRTYDDDDSDSDCLSVSIPIERCKSCEHLQQKLKHAEMQRDTLKKALKQEQIARYEQSKQFEQQLSAIQKDHKETMEMLVKDWDKITRDLMMENMNVKQIESERNVLRKLLTKEQNEKAMMMKGFKRKMKEMQNKYSQLKSTINIQNQTSIPYQYDRNDTDEKDLNQGSHVILNDGMEQGGLNAMSDYDSNSVAAEDVEMNNKNTENDSVDNSSDDESLSSEFDETGLIATT